MTDDEIQAIRYRFSGYNLPMEQLDSTGPAYYVIPEPHPYYSNQPMDWQKPYFHIQPIGTDSALSSNQTQPFLPSAAPNPIL